MSVVIEPVVVAGSPLGARDEDTGRTDEPSTPPRQPRSGHLRTAIGDGNRVGAVELDMLGGSNACTGDTARDCRPCESSRWSS